MRLTPPSRSGRLAAKPPLAGPRQRIGLLGGTFNPPHAAHRLISEIALKRLGLDRVWWLITPGNPLKVRGSMSSLEARARDCAMLVADEPRIVVTTFEKDLPSAYTAATLDFLRLRYPETSFVWVMGADCLAEFHRWRQWPHIFETMPIAVVDRPGWRLKANASKAAQRFAAARLPEARAAQLAGHATPSWTLLTGPLSPQSSTALRARGDVARKTRPKT